MRGATSFLVVLVTCPDRRRAHTLAAALVKARVAACVNLIPAVQSLFWWEGRVDQAREVLLVIKTAASSFPKLRALVTRLHPYQVPEIIALPIARGHAPYLAWIRKSLQPRRRVP